MTGRKVFVDVAEEVGMEGAKNNWLNHELFSYKTRNQKEVDVIIKKGTKIVEMIQVCADVRGQKTLTREVAALDEAGEELACGKKTLVTMDTNGMIAGGEVEIALRDHPGRGREVRELAVREETGVGDAASCRQRQDDDRKLSADRSHSRSRSPAVVRFPE